VRFSGAVLTGGSSSRMGTDKAFVEIDGVPMAGRARHALVAAGAAEVLAIGGDSRRLATLGFDARPDSAPGEGPLAGIIDALAAATESLVVVLACDQPEVGARLIRRLVSSFGPVDDAVVPIVNGRAQPLTAGYATRAGARLREAFDAGERAPWRALEQLEWRALHGVDAAQVRDVDDPDDLARYAARSRISTEQATSNDEG